MSVTAYSGPIWQYGTTLSSTSGDGITGQDMEHNDQRAPMFADLGDAMMDPRSAYDYQPGSGVSKNTFGFYNNQGVVDYVPATSTGVLSAQFVTSTETSTSFTTYTIPSSVGVSSNGVISTTIIAPETGKATSTLLAID